MTSNKQLFRAFGAVLSLIAGVLMTAVGFMLMGAVVFASKKFGHDNPKLVFGLMIVAGIIIIVTGTLLFIKKIKESGLATLIVVLVSSLVNVILAIVFFGQGQAPLAIVFFAIVILMVLSLIVPDGEEETEEEIANFAETDANRIDK